MTQEEFKNRYQYNPASDKLGEGGFGSVFKAYDTFRDRWVALKISKVNPEYESIRLKKEVEMVAKLPVHPNIAYYEDCYTFASFDGEYDFGILQYYEQGNLSQLLKQGGLSVEQKQSILTQILSGIEFLHSNGIIHRDLKPQNILMVKRGNEYIPKITDFGISKQLDVNKSSVFSNSIAGAGTLAYASPEQLGDRTIRKNADLWSFGVIAYQTLTGSLPFTTGAHAVTSEAGRVELFRQVNSGVLPAIINNIAEPWQKLIRACLVSDPDKRIKNCEACTTILKGEEAKTYEDSTRVEKSSVTQPTKPEKPKSKSQSPSKPAIPKIKFTLKKRIFLGIVALGIVMFLIMLYINQWMERPPSAEDLANMNIEMVDVAGGTFTMGCSSEQGADCYDDEKPAHQVTLSNFRIGKYEVTQAQWQVVMGNNPSYFKGDNLPVEKVSWNDVQEFLRKLNQKTGKQYRLPTEAEWEYAARGGSQSRGYKYSGSNTLSEVAWFGDNSGDKTHPVGGKKANELGIYDMTGNVWEWCSDWYGDYGSGSQMNPKGPSSGSARVLRGGCYRNLVGYCRVAYRSYNSPGYRYDILGFRVVLP